jgi:hypothetical protein
MKPSLGSFAVIFVTCDVCIFYTASACTNWLSTTIIATSLGYNANYTPKRRVSRQYTITMKHYNYALYVGFTAFMYTRPARGKEMSIFTEIAATSVKPQEKL